MKNTIRLTESELKGLISESVKAVINELDWRTYASAADKRYEQGREEDGDKLINASNKAAMKLAKQDISRYAREYDSWYGNRSKYAKGKGWQNESELRNMLESEIPNPMGGSENRINPYPEYAKDFDDEEPMFPIPNKQRLHTLDRTTDAFGDWQKGDHAYYDDGEVYPSAEWSDTDMYGKPAHYSQWTKDADKELEKMQNQRFKDSLDKQWQNTKDIEKYTKQSDSRPLHRKGSLNRAMDENVIRKLVSESIKKVLNEKWYPEDDDDISDYSFGMIAKLSTRSLMQLDEEAIARLEQVNDENIETQSSYVNVMVRNIGVSCDEDGDCSLNIECAVSAPDMPIHEIEQEVEEILWYWIEERTGQHLVSGFDWESEDTVFDNRTKNK